MVEAPPRPLPAWTAADFDCGAEPDAPPQTTTRARAEGYTIEVLSWGRRCSAQLRARGDDAARYDLIGGGAR